MCSRKKYLYEHYILIYKYTDTQQQYIQLSLQLE